jgi:hypothetical protein
MVRKQVYLDTRQDGLLKKAARETGKTESQLIRDAIDDAYDPDAARRRREAVAEEWHRGNEEFARWISERGGIGPWKREDLYRDRLDRW